MEMEVKIETNIWNYLIGYKWVNTDGVRNHTRMEWLNWLKFINIGNTDDSMRLVHPSIKIDL